MDLAPHPPPTTSSASKSPCGGDAAFLVLSSPQLFPLIPQWKTGWPARVAQRWRCIRGFALADLVIIDHRELLFVRELMLMGDIDTLRLLDECTWRNSKGEPMPFDVEKPRYAVRSGHAEIVRWVLERCLRRKPPHPLLDRTELWELAFTDFPGHCDVLDVMRELLPVSKEFWMDKHDCFRSAMSVQWVMDAYGVDALSPLILRKAALYGRLSLVEFMVTVPGQNVDMVLASLGRYALEVRVFLKETYNIASFSNMFKRGFVHDVVKRVASLFVGASRDSTSQTKASESTSSKER